MGTCSICLDTKPSAWSGELVAFRHKEEKTEVEHRIFHVFHERCLSAWVEKSNTCPQCRSNPADKSFMQTLPIDQKIILIDDINFAVLCREVKVVKHLLKTKQISIKDREQAICNAAKVGCVEAMELLLGSESLSKETRDIAILQASFGGSIEILRFLLVNRKIPQNALNQATAASNARGSNAKEPISTAAKIIQYLLVNGIANAAIYKEKAMANANYEGVIKLLLNHDIIRGAVFSEKARGQAVCNAAIADHIGIIKLLLENDANNIPVNDQIRAIGNAATTEIKRQLCTYFKIPLMEEPPKKVCQRGFLSRFFGDKS